MFISAAALAISTFNMIMCVENEFDPVLIEVALQQRRKETELKFERQQTRRAAKLSQKKQKQYGEAIFRRLKTTKMTESQQAFLQ